nr:hypothetical protein [Tanacetum cinerariifolium]
MKKVEALEQDKIAQALEITKLKQRVRRLENKNKLKASGLRRLKKVGTAQRIESFANTVMDDHEDASKQGGIIAKIDADKDVTLEEVNAEVDGAKDAKVAKDTDVQGRLEESQAQVYHIDLEHADKVLSIHDDEPKPTDLKEVIGVVTTAKLMTKVVTAAATTIVAAPITTVNITAAPSAARGRKGVVIRDPEELLLHQPQSTSQKEYDGISENMAGFKMDFFKGMSYDDIRPIFEKHFNSVVGFLEKSEKELEEKASRALKRKTKSSEQQAVKKQKLDEEVEELKKHLQIVPNDEDDVYTEANPLALKVPGVDYQIHTENNKPYYKIIRVDETHQIFLSFLSLLRNFDREDLDVLWKIVQKRFASSKPNNFSDDFLLTTLKAMFEKPNVEAQV